MLCRVLRSIFTVLLLFPGVLPGQEKQQPNILFVIADDWSDHAGVYGDTVVRTPFIDRIAQHGAIFLNAFAAAPSCTPSRASILTGRYPHQLEEGASLWGFLPKKFDNYTTILQSAGYHVGVTGKGWGPGNFVDGGYEYNPAGKPYKDFATFLAERPPGAPFSFWFGSQNPHRPYTTGAGAASGLNPNNVRVPAWLPDAPVVRNDILDYYTEVEAFDRQFGELLKTLEASGEFDNTVIIITGDNGMPFPRAKANLYDAGTRVPLIVSMPKKISKTKIQDLVSLTDIAPTILEVCGQPVPEEMTGKSLWPLLAGEPTTGRKMVFSERERHANVREPELGYPGRAVRTFDYLYIRNYEPNRWPAGDPELYHSVGAYGDVDNSPSKQFIIEMKNDPRIVPFFSRAFEKRPAEELYDLRADPAQLKNIVSSGKHRKALAELRRALEEWQIQTGDPRGSGQAVMFDAYPYYGPPVKGAPSTYTPQKK